MNGRAQRSRLHESLLNEGFQRWNGTYTGGRLANNRLVLDYDSLQHHNLSLFGRVIKELCKLTEAYTPEFVAGVQRGETGYVSRVAAELDIQPVRLAQKNIHGTLHISYASELDEYTASELAPRGVLIEDVVYDRRGTRAALEFDDLGPKIIAAVSIFDRSPPSESQNFDIPINSLVTEPIPAMLGRSKLWQFAK